MKKTFFIFSTIGILLVGVIACNKDNASNEMQPLIESSDFDSPIVEEFYEEDAPDKEIFELQERASAPLPKITSIVSDAGSFPAAIDGCTNHPYSTRQLMASNENFTITGENFGAAKGTGSVTASYKVKGVEYTIPVQVNTWSPTSISAEIGTIADTFPVASLKFTVNSEYKKDTATAMILKAKSKSVKVVGVWNTGNDDYFYGTQTYEIAKQRSAASKTPLIPTSFTTIDTATTNYVPAVGDVVQRTAGDKGVVVAVGSPDSKLRIPVTVWQRNSTCKGSVKKGTWKTLKGGFIAKSSETAGTWTKFSH